jgi:hypothetical protein
MAGLRRALDTGGQRPADRERGSGPVDVPPAQRQELSEADPCVGGDPDRLAVTPILKELKLPADAWASSGRFSTRRLCKCPNNVEAVRTLCRAGDGGAILTRLREAQRS